MSGFAPSASSTAPPRPTSGTSDKEYFKAKVRQKRREKRLAKGLPVSDDEPDVDEVEEGVSIIFQGAARGHRVELHHGSVAVKQGVGINLGEAEVLRIAKTAGLPVPHVHSVANLDGVKKIRMDYVPGQTLEQIWEDLTIHRGHFQSASFTHFQHVTSE